MPVNTYTHGHAEPVLQSHRWRTAENSAAHLLPSLATGMDLLDVGCGPRDYAVDLARRVAPTPVRLVDERLSTVQAQRALHETGHTVKSSRSRIDAAAAVVILQAALDSERATGGPVGEVVES